ncbi:MAG: hypothetical protein BRC41_04485 [Cyanobacteria bacterium QH_9_48_43]|nr:MAG: hypothetical protein BRC41_04485 [Cyanobacteria bacterium QH_9_48_43]
MGSQWVAACEGRHFLITVLSLVDIFDWMGVVQCFLSLAGLWKLVLSGCFEVSLYSFDNSMLGQLRKFGTKPGFIER